MGLGAVDAYGDVPGGGTQFLIESAVGTDPQVVLCDFHLGKQTHNIQNTLKKHNRDIIITIMRHNKIGLSAGLSSDVPIL